MFSSVVSVILCIMFSVLSVAQYYTEETSMVDHTEYDEDSDIDIEDIQSSDFQPDTEKMAGNENLIVQYDNFLEPANTNVQIKSKEIAYYEHVIPDGWEVPLSTPEIIRSYGLHVQTHEVATRDGYILTLHRIISNFEYVVTNTSKVVLFHHGIFGNSADWLIGGSESLPFLLSRHDIWLANARGTIYSRSHLNHSVNSDDFWNFSFHEIGIYDLPPIFRYIKTMNGYSSSLYFIGHSMGATAFLVTMSTLPEFNRLVKLAVFLAPLAFMQRAEGPFKRLSQMDHNLIWTQLGLREIPMKTLLFRMLHKEYCFLPKAVCNNPLVFLSNGADSLLGTETLHMALTRRHSEGSTKTLIHYLQLLQSGDFKLFDDSEHEPDEYNVKKVTVPLIVFTSNSDILAPTWDAVTLVMKIPNMLVHQTVNARYFSHMDFVWGLKASNVLYQDVVSLLRT